MIGRLSLDLSVRQKFKVGDPQYNVNFLHRCLYENETGDPSNVESGFLKGSLLLKVRRPYNESVTCMLICLTDIQAHIYFTVLRGL